MCELRCPKCELCVNDQYPRFQCKCKEEVFVLDRCKKCQEFEDQMEAKKKRIEHYKKTEGKNKKT